MITVYEVMTEPIRDSYIGMKFLGYAVGAEKDIRAYYEDQMVDVLDVRPLDVLCITHKMVKEKRKLLREKNRLSKRQEVLGEQLKSLEQKVEGGKK